MRARPKHPKTQPTKWDIMSMGRLVRGLREQLKLPDFFTLDSCRHGGMTELEEAELADGQGRALSAHRSKAYDGYAKRTEKHALAATRKRHAHRIASHARRQPRRSQRPVNVKQVKGNRARNGPIWPPSTPRRGKDRRCDRHAPR
jgi:hypothetical protein